VKKKKIKYDTPFLVFSHLSLFLYLQLYKQSLELRKYQEQLSVELSKNSTNEYEHQQLQNTIQLSKEQIEKLQQDFKQAIIQNEQYEYTINELNSRNDLIESKLIEAMTLIDLRNKTLLDNEQQMDKIKIELVQKHKEILDKQSHIDELEQIVIDKTADVAELTETLETGLVRSHHREKSAEENASKALHDIKILQREVKKNKRFYSILFLV
jgi:chromosome segregation ATPase